MEKKLLSSIETSRAKIKIVNNSSTFNTGDVEETTNHVMVTRRVKRAIDYHVRNVIYIVTENEIENMVAKGCYKNVLNETCLKQ